jgi:hypothetical protein
MTPEEKAKELLFEKFVWIIYSMDKYHAKKCALICVDEILALFISECEDTRFWNDVKSEIEKL